VIWDFAWLGLAGLDQQAFFGDSSAASSLFGTFLEEIKKGCHFYLGFCVFSLVD
jgi:hypothetical protein